MDNGYIKLFRSLMEKGYYTDSQFVHLWVHLLMKASYYEKEFLFNDKIHNLKPGQFITGRHILVKETGINRSKLERILKCFESEHQIEQQTTNKFRVISIVNWERYQSSEHQDEQPVSSQQAASEQPVSTIKKVKKVKKVFIAPTIEQVIAYCQERNKGVNPERWHAHYVANGWKVGRAPGMPMQDWKGAVRTWEGSQYNQPLQKGASW